MFGLVRELTTAASMTLATLSNDDGTDSYIQTTQSIPVVTFEAETDVGEFMNS